jgi:hypothetical protein
LRQRGFDFIAEVNVNAGGGVSLLFHAAESKTVKSFACEKISCEMLILFEIKMSEPIK